MKETEEWKSLDFMGYPNYKVSNFGRVKSLNYKRSGKERILKQYKNTDGYLQVDLYKDRKRKQFRTHCLVAFAFILNPLNLPCVNHKDENKQNNHVDNLEFCTHAYNMNYGTRNERISEAMKGKGTKPILQFTKEGEFIRYWDSAKSANIELNINGGNITKCCKGKLKSSGGFIWKYKE